MVPEPPWIIDPAWNPGTWNQEPDTLELEPRSLGTWQGYSSRQIVPDRRYPTLPHRLDIILIYRNQKKQLTSFFFFWS